MTSSASRSVCCALSLSAQSLSAISQDEINVWKCSRSMLSLFSCCMNYLQLHGNSIMHTAHHFRLLLTRQHTHTHTKRITHKNKCTCLIQNIFLLRRCLKVNALHVGLCKCDNQGYYSVLKVALYWFSSTNLLRICSRHSKSYSEVLIEFSPNSWPPSVYEAAFIIFSISIAYCYHVCLFPLCLDLNLQ